MTEPATSSDAPTQTSYACDRCGKNVRAGRVFAFKAPAPDGGTGGGAGEMNKCFSCAVRHRTMLKRSIIAAFVVGTILTALNQGDAILYGQWNNALYWKIPLTYCVPFIVATYGALTNSRK